MSQVNIFENARSWFVDPMMNLSIDIGRHYSYLNLIAGAIDIISKDNIIYAIESEFNDKEKLFKLSEQAKLEIESNHENVVRDGIIILFSKLESGIKDIIKSIFIHAPTMFEDESIKGMKISYAEYRKYNEDELADLFLIDYERTFLKEKYGFERFECMLKPVGLAGRPEWNVTHKKELIELSMVRNLLVHKNGIVDKQFLGICGYLPYKIGEKIKVDIPMIGKYVDGVNGYIVQLVQRFAKVAEEYQELVTLTNEYQLNLGILADLKTKQNAS